jgi:hypothetical protein
VTKVTEKDVGKMATPYGRIRESAAGNTATPARTPQRNRRRDGIEENVVREEEKFNTDVRGFRQPWRSTGAKGTPLKVRAKHTIRLLRKTTRRGYTLGREMTVMKMLLECHMKGTTY